MRRYLCIFLLMMLPLQSFAVQNARLSHAETVSLAHEMEHLEGTSHHHEKDGSVHYDKSGESADHFAEHSTSQQAPALTSAILPNMSVAPLSTSPPDFRQYIPDPIPERPQRPPLTLG